MLINVAEQPPETSSDHTFFRQSVTDTGLAPSTSSARLLVVDWDPSRLWRLTRDFVRRGMQVTPALEGSRCLRLLKEQQHHLVVAALPLTHWAGEALLRWIHRHRPMLPIIELHPRPTVFVRKLGLMRGATYVASNDVDGSRLARLIRCYLDLTGFMPSAQEVLRELLSAASLGTGGVMLMNSPDVAARLFMVEDQVAWSYLKGGVGLLSRIEPYTDASSDQVRAVLSDCRTTNSNFVEALVRAGFIRQELMRRVLLEQIGETLRHVFQSSGVATRFMPQPWSYGSSLLFPIDDVLSATRFAAGQHLRLIGGGRDGRNDEEEHR